MMWFVVVATSLAAWLQKYLGHLVPESFVNHPRVQRATLLLPVGLLAALIAVSTFTESGRVSFDARIAGLAAAFVALLLRAPFLVVLAVAAVVAAGVRAFTG
ncbi:MAG: AzlD domain-containing protein [Actinobacteria bacterium]|nr:AzlD domain-containing protein [Actinomycetota bacterium]